MNTKGFKSNERESGLADTGHFFALPVTAEQYSAPDIEVIDIELTQNILTASLPDVGDGGDAW
jgi:hypothetical protein